MAHRWKVLAVVSLAVFMSSLDLFIVNVAFPDIEASFPGADAATVSWVLNAYAIVVAALMVGAGRLADRSGRRALFLAGLGLFAVGSALCGAAGSIEVLIAARALQAAGAAALLPTSLALLLPEFPAHERPAAIGIWASVGGLAAACGPPLGGLLVEVSWRLVFLVNVPVAAAAAWAAMRLLRESRDPTQDRPDLVGAALLTGGIGVLALALVQAPSWGWGGARTTGALALAALGLAAFWGRCLTHPAPIVDPALLRVRSFATANVASLLFSAAFAAMLLGIVLFLTDVWHRSTLEAGLALAPGPLAAAALAPVAGRAVGHAGPRPIAATGIALFGLGCAWWLWRLGDEPAYAAQMLPGLLATGAGVGLTLPSLGAAAAGSLPPHRFATGSAVFTMSRQLGFVMGVAVLLAVLGETGPAATAATFDRGWSFMVVAAGAATAAALLLPVPARGPRRDSGLATTRASAPPGDIT